MKKVLFICSAGMSTSLLVKKTEEAAKKQNLNIEILALGEAQGKKVLKQYDIVMLGPQVRYLLSTIKTLLKDTDIPVDIIDTIAYGRMDGEKVIEQMRKLITLE